MEIAEVQSIHLYPVKAFQGLAVDAAAVEPWGLAGDRRWALIDDGGKVVTQREQPRLALAAAEPLAGGGLRLSAAGRAAATVEVPEPSGTVPVNIFGQKVEAVPAAPAAHAWCSAYLGQDVRLVHLDDPATRRPVDPEYALPGETVSFADGYPLLVTASASLDALNSLISRGRHAAEGPLPMDRFRPGVVVRGTEAWAEDEWTRLSIGEVVFRVARTCRRCVVTTTDQGTAARGREPLYTLARHRRIDGGLIFGQNVVPLTRGTVRVGDPVRVLERGGSGAGPNAAR
ncbi:MOSC domain-containing protein [Streptomyces malaysiense]|uniref:MOSC domain-containing protein n=1 Tax=Streptomyces malaysiense TaxID=1428626 RepID=A0A1J4Q0Y9_9ACTN|nr:MOSC N-terminal beta barrel domain-containing protein [Streptomyces malaysiense]OIK26078.1 MOSC domain-containing protein [Streptomyces malaysiense]